jgi:hypothetical protein
MEFFAFLGAVVVVGIVLLVRSRGGGSGTRMSGRPDHLDDGPIGYGSSVSPPGTAPGAEVNVGWFSRDHSRSNRGGDAAE